eukprot:2133235-Alexandrium_andersonii.AAC.1
MRGAATVHGARRMWRRSQALGKTLCASKKEHGEAATALLEKTAQVEDMEAVTALQSEPKADGARSIGAS